MKKARVIVMILALAVLALSWSFWAGSGTAPVLVSAAWDESVWLLTGKDPHRRCVSWEQEKHAYMSLDERACYHFAPPARYRGIYVDEFEGQLFIENGLPAKVYTEPKRRVWVAFDKKTDSSAAKLRAPRAGAQFWLVDVFGRETDRGGNYGHMGASDATLLVDHVNSATPLQHVDGYAPNTLLVRR